MNTAIVVGLSIVAGVSQQATELTVPPRPGAALSGSQFAQSIRDLPLEEREERVLAEVKAGNVPPFLRKFAPVTVTHGDDRATYFVSPDYLAIGANEDYVLIPLTPRTAQAICDSADCVLPTTKIVDAIYANATLKLTPAPIPPSPKMTSVPVFMEHNRIVLAQRSGKSLGDLVAGHKKDVVVSNKISDAPEKVAIYGWHKPDGKPIQPLYAGHSANWVDYSHGIRLVRRKLVVNRRETTVEDVLSDPKLAPLLSDEGVIAKPRYELKKIPPPRKPAARFVVTGEANEVLQLASGVRVLINRPEPAISKDVLLVFYALPNGNTIEQTIGKTPKPGDDWHFDIQHIGAQARFVRERLKDRGIVLVYLENDLRSWPAWRKKHGDAAIPAILRAARDRFDGSNVRIVLNGHSGGGSLIFGYLNSQTAIPDDVERIAFLDSNYAYETDRHRDKLVAWLKSSRRHYLCVVAYNDAVALLNGKTFVSAEGGAWGRSRRMLNDLETEFTFAKQTRDATDQYTALGGRVEFLLTNNPDRKILHTIQVDRNGFIHSLLSGTTLEGVNYRYLGDRAYSKWIAPE